MKKVFATNLRKARTYHGWTQEEAAKLIGINRPKYQSYEEGRAEPGSVGLINIAETMGIANLVGFVTDQSFDMKRQNPVAIRIPKTPLESNYQRLKGKERKIADILLFGR